MNESTFSSNIATAPSPFIYVSRGAWPYLKSHPQTLAFQLNLRGRRMTQSDYIPFIPFFEDRSKHLSSTRYSDTDKLVARGLKPLEKTPSGRSSGPSGNELIGTRYKEINFVPPSSVQKEAQKGIDLRKRNEERKKLPKGHSDRLDSGGSLGGTDIGVARAVQLISGEPLTPRAVKRMSAFFGRHNHEGSKNFGNDKTPSAGYVAHLLWGGDSGELWAKEIIGKMEKADAKVK